ncbi:MAG: hypothetical protein JJ895_11145 [Balneolaceae bacterium]|nr:hypothetical protein [Balneolaceae bacterium]
MQLCFFDDESASNFLPLTLTRPTDDLRIGIFTIREKWEKWLKPSQTSRITKPYLSKLFHTPSINETSDCLWINSRCIPKKSIIDSIIKLKTGDALYYGNILIACRVSGKESINNYQKSKIPTVQNQISLKEEPTLITYYWDLLSLNGPQIKQDIKLKRLHPIKTNKLNNSIVTVNSENIFIADTAEIEPGVTIFADKGPVYIGAGAVIESGSVLRGPLAICDHSKIISNARISDGTTIGPVCKAAGEINNCIFHSYSNKSHDGFAGNSIFGQWCNLAAGTITSNLKSNYGHFRVPHWQNGSLSERKVQFFGTVFGDFTKTAIQTRINVGTICGVNTNILTTDFTPKKIPSFTWLTDNGAAKYDFEKASEAMQAMMARRNVELTVDYKEMMKIIYDS